MCTSNPLRGPKIEIGVTPDLQRSFDGYTHATPFGFEVSRRLNRVGGRARKGSGVARVLLKQLAAPTYRFLTNSGAELAGSKHQASCVRAPTPSRAPVGLGFLRSKGVRRTTTSNQWQNS